MHPDELFREGAGGVALVLIAAAALWRQRRQRGRLRAVLGAGCAALATLLVIWAGLLLRNDVQMRSLTSSIRGADAAIAALALRSDKYGAPEQRQVFFDGVMARLRHVPGIRVDDSGGALPLAGGVYYAMFFAAGDDSPGLQLPNEQRPVRWRADMSRGALADEVNRAVKSFDRGIHYWHVGSDVSRVTGRVFGVYAALALVLIYLGFRRDGVRRGIATAAAGMAIGLVLARATTWLLTGLLWGVSVTDTATFVVAAGMIAGVVLVSGRIPRA